MNRTETRLYLLAQRKRWVDLGRWRMAPHLDLAATLFVTGLSPRPLRGKGWWWSPQFDCQPEFLCRGVQ